MQVVTLILQALFLGAMAYVVAAALTVMGKRPIASLVKVMAIVLCVTNALQAVSMAVKSVADFLSPMMRFFDRF